MLTLDISAHFDSVPHDLLLTTVATTNNHSFNYLVQNY